MGVAKSHAIHLTQKSRGKGMRVIRKRLEANIAAVLFCGKQVVVVDKRLPGPAALAAVAVVIDRCDGVLGIVKRSELKVARALMA